MKVPASNETSNPASVPALSHRTTPTAAGGGLHPGSDQVQFSSLGHRLSALDAEPSAHESRIVELSGVVASGRYHVDAGWLSDKIIQEHIRSAA